jgi:UDP-N-acetylglucosamine 2-epimerase (non-hydrolysing)
MKIAPVLRATDSGRGWKNVLVHSGQHYDAVMSEAFFHDLNIRAPDWNLEVGSGTHAAQTAGVLAGLEPVLDEEQPDLVIVVGDVNSTLAAALCAAKKHVPVAHVEAGLRSGDRRMPEELNRILTDQLSTLCFTPSRDGDENLKNEGISEERIHFVGNVMIDTLENSRAQAASLNQYERYGLRAGEYVLVTLHRPSNVDDSSQLSEIVDAIDAIAGDIPVVVPIHPRTSKNMERFGLSFGSAKKISPLGYMEMLSLMASAGLVLTDSGGIQEETTALGVPCVTLRSTTERPITIDEGTNLLVPERSKSAILDAFAHQWGRDFSCDLPEGWDGQAAHRIADVIADWAEHRS